MFTLGDWPLRVLVWSVVICVVLVIFAATAYVVAKLMRAARDNWRSERTAPPPPPPAPIEIAPVAPRTGPKRQAAAKLFLGDGDAVLCEKCGAVVKPTATRIVDTGAVLCHDCPKCGHTTQKPLSSLSNGSQKRQPLPGN